MKKVVIPIVLCAILLTGCREAERVSYNISKQADNFNVQRRLSVFNMRTDKCIMQMTGCMSIDSDSNNNELDVIVEVDREKGIYQKHMIYLNEWTMYTIEDVSGTNVSRYAYEVEFMPQTLMPVKITADELKQDMED